MNLFPKAVVTSYFRSRASLLLAMALCSFVIGIAAGAPPARSAEAIAAMLGSAAGGSVLPDDFIWEERGGFLRDLFFGRNVLFLAAMPPERPGGAIPHEIFRARVRLTRSGRPIALATVKNISRTPLGDERDLIARGRFVAFSTVAYGVVQKITLLDRKGDLQPQHPSSSGERLRARLENWMETASPAGIAMTEVSFAMPPDQARFELTDGALVMALGPTAAPAALSLHDGSLNPGPENPHGVRAQRIPHPVRPWSGVITEAVRAQYGPAAAATLRSALLRLHTLTRTPRPRPWPHPVRSPSSAAESTPDWPPPPIAPPIAPALDGEGLWVPPAVSLGSPPPGLSQAPVPAFYETTLRPDPEQPGAIAHIVVMDTRQVDIRLQAGFDQPRPKAGPRGQARIPKEMLSRAVAAFAGATAAPDPLGMVVDGQVLVPPLPGAPTIAVDRLGRSAFGDWPFLDAIPAEFHSLRQARPLAHSQPQPGTRGPALARDPAEDRAPAERSAMCLQRDGHALYAWGQDLTAASLAKALELSRCDFSIELGKSPGAVGFSFFQLGPDGPAPRLLAPEMSLDPTQFVHGSPADFFYVILRDPRPSLPSLDGAAWEPDAARQPPPSWLPALHTTTTVKLGVDVRLLSFAPERFLFRLRAGHRELPPRFGGTYPTALADGELPASAVAIGLGNSRRRGARGLVFSGTVRIPVRQGAALLALDGTRITLVPSSRDPSLPATTDAAELPMTADEGKELPDARLVGTLQPRAAVCILSDGTVLVATTTFDTDEAATQALLDAGCSRVAALDRGSHHAAFVHRAGTDSPPLARYEMTTLYAVGTPLKGRDYRLAAP
jgi:hypothetical protein